MIQFFNAALAATALALIGVTAAKINDLQQEVEAAVEAVAIIEEAANSIEEDIGILRTIADREQCYDDRGEWSDEYGCVLQELNQ